MRFRIFPIMLWLVAGCWVLGAPAVSASAKAPLNVMLMTADDLHCESLASFGGKIPDLMPNLDRLAHESMRFLHAHVTAAICQPSRGALGTGRYGHNSGVFGFMHTTRQIPTVMQTFRDHGYLTGVLGKVGHSTPHADYKWDYVHDQKELGAGRDPAIYYRYCREFLERCRQEGKPFYFMVNSHDPHRPYHIPGKPIKGAVEPSKIYRPKDVPVPGFVPDLPKVRLELSYYLNSTRRCDDTFGKVLQALEESGFADNTLVMFLSDNGIAIPFAKCNAYFASTHTPWIVRWPGVTKPNSIDDDHFIAGVDFFPTVLEAAGIPIPHGLDGRSFAPLLRGQSQEGRDHVFTQIDKKAGNAAVPMRCVQNAQFGYIYNPWSDGTYWYRNNNEGMTMQAMNEAAGNDASIAQRVRMFRYRAPEEFYDLRTDADCIHNLIDDPKYQNQIESFRTMMLEWMETAHDPLLEAFKHRDQRAVVERVMRDFYGPQPKNAGKPRQPKKPKRSKNSKNSK